MDEFLSLETDRLYDLGMTVACIADSNPRSEVEESIPIHILYPNPFSSLDDQGVNTGVRLGDEFLVFLQDLFGFRARKFT
jgi:hypothetical protein